jgi:hypothetical protein
MSHSQRRSKGLPCIRLVNFKRKVCQYFNMSYGTVHCFKSFDLIFKIADNAFFGLDCFHKLNLFFFDKVSISFYAFQLFLDQLELFIKADRLLFFDVVLLLIFLKQLDLLIFLYQFNLQLLEMFLILKLEFIDLRLIFLIHFLCQILHGLFVFCS